MTDSGYTAEVQRVIEEAANVRRATLEEAAKAVEAHSNRHGATYQEYFSGKSFASAIRALSHEGEPQREARVFATDEQITLVYTNHRGETAPRTIFPKSIRFGSTEWHPKPQWLLLAFDVEKRADREFALKDFEGEPHAAGHERPEIEKLRANINRAYNLVVELERYGTIDHSIAFEIINALQGGYPQETAVTPQAARGGPSPEDEIARLTATCEQQTLALEADNSEINRLKDKCNDLRMRSIAGFADAVVELAAAAKSIESLEKSEASHLSTIRTLVEALRKARVSIATWSEAPTEPLEEIDAALASAASLKKQEREGVDHG